ncbi:MAG: Gfo/Idh/MocA family oxidoreductase [Actinobacteria bacterium]|nr:Gfo/Idh/MocA family oxidoreductase [Actinomycetota bacterium]
MSAAAPVRVGLVGAGAWAGMLHAPMLAAGPQTALAGVWSRSHERAGALAERHPGAVAFPTLADLLRESDAVAFAVAPDAQAALAVVAVDAGKPLLLEKPLALDLAAAERLVAAIAANAVPNVVVLTNRFAAPVREFLRDAATFEADGARALFVSGAFLDGPFASSSWRKEHGGLLDVGPHIVDLVDAALGRIVRMQRAGEPSGRLVQLLCTHDGGAVSAVTIDCTTAGEGRTEIELFGPAGRLHCDARTADDGQTVATLRAEFAHCARTGEPHEVDAARALAIQRWLQ